MVTNYKLVKQINMLAIGTQAPDFELFSTPDQKLKLSELLGKKVILVFYPANWSPVCSDQLVLYNETLKLFSKHNAQLIGISTDSKWSHLAFSQNRQLHFPLLADFEPKGKVAKMYGVYDEKEGLSLRAIFVLDEKGIIRWNYLSPVGINPGADGILEAIEDMDKVKSVI